MIINKKGELSELWILLTHLTTKWHKNKSKTKEKYQDFAKELKKKSVERESSCYTNSHLCSWYSHKNVWWKDERTGK